MTPVEVTGHAVDRARERHHYERMPRRRVATMIELEVASAITDGRVSTSKPAWTKLISKTEMHQGLSAKRTPLGDGERFVWNEAETLGWIVKHEAGRLVVVTSLHRVRAAASAPVAA